MTFMAAILAWLVSLSLSGNRMPGQGVTTRPLEQVFTRLGGRIWVYVLAMAVPVLLLSAILAWFDLWLVTFLVGFGSLVLVFGSSDQVDQLKQYRQYQVDGESDRAYELAVEAFDLPEGLYEGGSEQMDEALNVSLAYQLLERFFVALFWFVAFGASGVLLVVLVRHARSILTQQPSEDNSAASLAVQVHHAINWIPARLLTLSLALVGDFSQSFAIWLRRVRDFELVDRALLESSLRVSLPENPDAQRPEDVLSLMKRAQVLWMVVIALATIFG
ncbi:regulatory signaling modulator protein AmpE [Saccharospirillum impatiens]|uniref:regulatory signaling modulator protein AmpE n=1 Tax=Saccharospirillum impatiens TaxID=169438 RepID=UPI0003F60E4D|nr:regulatory signaling modulator protein AmpE [Saccharospirillum impatiens]